MNFELINKIIKDTTNKNLISDGNFTLGELHSDRISLFVTLLNFIIKIYEYKQVDTSKMVWCSDISYDNIKSPEGYIHLGISLGDSDKDVIAALMPKVILNNLNGVIKKEKAPKYKNLNETLKIIKI